MMCDHTWIKSPHPEQNTGSWCSKCQRWCDACFDDHGSVLTLHFPDKETANAWKAYMCDGGGEQQLGAVEEQIGRYIGFDWHQGADIPVELGPIDEPPPKG